MACGTQTEGPESPYTGMCKNADDAGNSTKCNEEEFKSCMTGVISKGEMIYFFPVSEPINKSAAIYFFLFKS
jgi:hypothetical protein